jgi:predicted N-acetyltransferase YhbS
MAPGTHYAIRTAEPSEISVVRNTIHSAFSLDMDWSDTLTAVQIQLKAELDRIFNQKEACCLVVTHGLRVIGASAMDLNHDAPNHLVSGPTILSEYRNRGLGSKLLYHSLQALHGAGLTRALGVIKSNVLAAKYIYPKFNSVGSPCEAPMPAVNQD